jgi:hypothetical protein
LFWSNAALKDEDHPSVFFKEDLWVAANTPWIESHAMGLLAYL